MAATTALQELVYRTNLELAASGLVMGTFGNLSAVDRAAGLMVIKPSGMPYDAMRPADMVPVSLETGEVVGSSRRPSSDTPTHLEIYRAFDCGAVVHTHSEFATLFAQSTRAIRCMGTTHADYFRGDVPVTRALTHEEIDAAYERHTGLAIVEAFRHGGIDPREVPAVLVAHHAPFAWGADPAQAIEHARVLEFVARLDWRGRTMAPDAPRPDRHLIDKHYLRKHGPRAYYGQSGGGTTT
jgi:L-ribulose-5-phosphate 4-epimerase